MKYLITYDISDDKVRNELIKFLLKYGKRVQFSCYEAELTITQLLKLEKKIKELIDSDVDKVYIFPLSKYVEEKIEKLGKSDKSSGSYIL